MHEDMKKGDRQKYKGFSTSWYSDMNRRINLQSLGGLIREGGLAVVDYNSFEERERRAYDTLEKYLNKSFGEDATVDIMEHVSAYCNSTHQIHFSLGMKAGAILMNKLTDNFETDV